MGEDASLMATNLVGFDSEQCQVLAADLMAVGMVLIRDTVMRLARAAEVLAQKEDDQQEAELANSIR